jgi:DNA-binding MarR family transcriptional regulator
MEERIRKSEIRLTDEGLRKIKEIIPDHFGKISKLMKVLNKNEKTSFLEYLDRVSANIGLFAKGLLEEVKNE